MAPATATPRRSKRATKAAPTTRSIKPNTNGVKPKRRGPTAKKTKREPTFDVQEVRGHQFIAGGRSTKSQYLVKWAGYPETENSWEPEDNIDAASKIEAYWARTKAVQGGDDAPKPKSKKRKSKGDGEGASSDAEEAEAEDVLGQEESSGDADQE